MTRIILWRHGQTHFNLEKRFQGHIDVQLNETGILQAENAAKILATYNPTHIVTSDLNRAKVTGQKLAEIIKVEMITDERIKERSFGKWEGLTHKEIISKWGKEYEEWCNGKTPENISMESIEQVSKRFSESVKYHVDKNSSDSVIVFVSHGGAIAKGILRLLGLSSDFRGIHILNNCSWAVLDKANSGEWVLSGYNLFP